MSTYRLTRRGTIAKAVITGLFLAICVGAWLGLFASVIALYLTGTR